jgi:hypothetical protein
MSLLCDQPTAIATKKSTYRCPTIEIGLGAPALCRKVHCTLLNATNACERPARHISRPIGDPAAPGCQSRVMPEYRADARNVALVNVLRVVRLVLEAIGRPRPLAKLVRLGRKRRER